MKPSSTSGAVCVWPGGIPNPKKAMIQPARRPAITRAARASVLPLAATLRGLALVLVAAAIFTSFFYTKANLLLTAQEVGFIGFATLSQTFIVPVGGIVLSVRAVSALTIVVTAVVSSRDAHLLGASLIALALGIGVGLANGLLVTLRNSLPLVATFVPFILVASALSVWTQGAPTGPIRGVLSPWGTGNLVGSRIPLLVCVGLRAVSAVALRRTIRGRRGYGPGSTWSLPG